MADTGAYVMWEGRRIEGLFTLQWSAGGLFDGRLVPGYDVCLIRAVRDGGSPGPTLCGRDRFDRSQPGWSVRGGIGGLDPRACAECVAQREGDYRDLPVAGMHPLIDLFAEPHFEPWDTWWRHPRRTSGNREYGGAES